MKTAAVEEAPEKASAIAYSRRAGKSHDEAVWALYLVGMALTLALAGAIGYRFLGPGAQALRAYTRGTRLLIAGDMPGARGELEKALRYRPNMAEAQLSLGFSWLGFAGDRFDEAGMKRLLDNARWGRTAELEAADAGFDRCIALAQTRPAGRAVRGLASKTNAQMIAVAWIGKGLTAMVRSLAAYDTAHMTDARAWIEVAFRDLDLAELTHRSEDTARLRKLAQEVQTMYDNPDR